MLARSWKLLSAAVAAVMILGCVPAQTSTNSQGAAGATSNDATDATNAMANATANATTNTPDNGTTPP